MKVIGFVVFWVSLKKQKKSTIPKKVLLQSKASNLIILIVYISSGCVHMPMSYCHRMHNWKYGDFTKISKMIFSDFLKSNTLYISISRNNAELQFTSICIRFSCNHLFLLLLPIALSAVLVIVCFRVFPFPINIFTYIFCYQLIFYFFFVIFSM